jgi:hypothetical protein
LSTANTTAAGATSRSTSNACPTHIELEPRQPTLAQHAALKRKRPRRLQVEVARAVWLAAYVELGSIGKACAQLGIGRRTFYN